MKLLQLNIWGGKLRWQLLDYFNAHQGEYDIICMQEVNDMPGDAEPWFASLDDIQKASGLENRFISPLYGMQFMRRQIMYGNAILSRLPFKHTTTEFTHGTFMDNFDADTDESNNRNFQHVIIDVNGTDLNVINYHGYYVEGSHGGNEVTEQHNQQIADYASRLSGSVILTGDFNLAPSSPSMQVLGTVLSELPTRYKISNTYSKLSMQHEVCDYVFTNHGISVTNLTLLEDLISDHKGLILDFNPS